MRTPIRQDPPGGALLKSDPIWYATESYPSPRCRVENRQRVPARVTRTRGNNPHTHAGSMVPDTFGIMEPAH